MNTTLLRKAEKKRQPAWYVGKFGNTEVQVYRRTLPGGSFNYMVTDRSEVGPDGKIKRRFKCYSNEQDARAEADTLAERLHRHHSIALRLTENEAIEYVGSRDKLAADPFKLTVTAGTDALVQCLNLLKPFNIGVVAGVAALAECLKKVGDLSNLHAAADCWKEAGDSSKLHAAVKFFNEQHRKLERKPLDEVVKKFLEIKAQHAGDRYMQDLKYRLNRFAADCKKDCCDITSKDIQNWLYDQGLSTQGYTNFRRVLNLLFKFAIGQEYAFKNVVEDVTRVKVKNGQKQTFNPVEVARLLEAAKAHYPQFLPSLAVGAFAGLRSCEIERLEWEHIDLPARLITINEVVAGKNGPQRVVPIQDNLAAWLADYSKCEGKVWKGVRAQCARALHNEFYDTELAVAAATEVKADPAKGIEGRNPVKWKSNAPRHSYASYRYAQTNDPGRVAGEMGNSRAVIMKHYVTLKKPADAVKWFGVMPETPANVVTLKGATA